MEAIPIGAGMRLHVIPSEKFTTATLCVLIRRPLARAEVTLNALLPGILLRGSARYPSLSAVRLAAEQLYGSIFETQIVKKGEQHILQCYLACVDSEPDVLSDGLDFLREILLNPLTDSDGFCSQQVRGEAEHLQQQIAARVNNKSEYAKLKCIEIMCENEPFGLYGDGYAEDLPSITPVGLLHHYKKMLASSPIDFIAIGRWDAHWLAERLGALFSQYRDDIIEIPPAVIQPARAERVLAKLDVGTAQGNLCVGLRGEVSPVGERFVHLQLANEVLGGGPNAKLFVHVREKESLCYSINSFVYRFKGILCIQSGVAPEQFEKVLSLIETQLTAVQQGDISDEEVDNAKQSLIKRWRSLQDYPSAALDFYASQYLLDETANIDQMTECVAHVTRDNIAAAAALLQIDTVVMAR